MFKVAIVNKPFLTINKGERFLVNEQNQLIDGNKKPLPIELSDDFFTVEEVEEKFKPKEWLNYNKEDGKVITVQVISFDPVKNMCIVKTTRKNSKEFSVDVKLLSKSQKYFYILSDGTVGEALFGANKAADEFRKRMGNVYETEDAANEYLANLK